ncbi:MAG: hypothetical protein ACXWP4_02795 [Polyangiales bacterium]
MDAAETFIRDFIAKEYEALRAKYGDPNPVFIPKLQAVNALFTRDVITKSGISRPSSAHFDELRPRQQSIVARRLLGKHEYAHPALGPLFECVLSGPEDVGSDAADAKYFVRDTDVGMRIVSYYLVCRDCTGTGRAAGRACARCGASGWVYADGVELASPGTLVR